MCSRDSDTTQIMQISLSLFLFREVWVYLRRLFATRRGGRAARGGEGGGAGLRGALLAGGGHLVQAVLPGRVRLHTAGGRRVLNNQNVENFTSQDKNYKLKASYLFNVGNLALKAEITVCWFSRSS